MKIQKILTVVVPSFNTSRYIDKGIGSFLEERLFNDVELLMINDGSSDDTAQRIRQYMEKYPELIRLIDKENGGHGSVINKGIEEAAGKYFKVVDGDDWVDADNLLKLVAFLKSSEADLVINPYISFGEISKKETLYGKMNLISGREYSIDEVINKGMNLKIHTATYRTDILRKEGIRFSEKCFYEDFEYANFPLLYVKTVAYLDFPVYYYLTEQKTQSVDNQSTYKNVDMFVRVYADSEAFLQKHKSNNSLVMSYIHQRVMVFLRQTYNVFVKNYHMQGIERKIDSVDQAVKKVSLSNYKELSKRYPYINLIRLKKRWMLHGMNVLLRLFK